MRKRTILSAKKKTLMEEKERISLTVAHPHKLKE